jgi:hypothetical protein
MDNNLNGFKEALQFHLDNELDNMETFSEEMAEHIRNVYANLEEQKRKWLAEKKKGGQS